MKLLLTSAFLVLALSVFSQKQYYVLIESENNQPFYVRIGDNNYSSSSVGHLILPSLIDSAYTLEIGFPKDQYPSNQFVIRIKKKDHGYELKNLADKGWVLFDYQTMELIYPVKKEDRLSQTGYSLVKRNDGFAKLLSKVVNDTAVLYMLVSEKPVATPAVANKNAVDSPVVKKEEAPKSETPKTQVPKEAVTIPTVVKLGEKDTDSGRQLTFIDNKDSVRILITTEPAEQKENPIKDSVNQRPNNPVNTIPVVIPATTELKKPAASEGAVPKDKEVVLAPQKSSVDSVSTAKDTAIKTTAAASSHDTASAPKKLVLINSDCKAIAWDNDVDKLRIKMLAEKDIDNKITIARKVFKTKCFSSNQIKALTELFLTDEQKYKFLDAAYPFVVDYDNFKQLSFLLTDPYYIKRFRTMVRLD